MTIVKLKPHQPFFSCMVVPSKDEMVERVSWFSPVDYEILMFFRKHDIILNAKIVAANIDYDRVYVNKRMRKLEKENILQNTDGIYELTDFGRKFLRGDIPPEDLERD